jgi:hypothetical protein
VIENSYGISAAPFVQHLADAMKGLSNLPFSRSAFVAGFDSLTLVSMFSHCRVSLLCIAYRNHFSQQFAERIGVSHTVASVRIALTHFDADQSFVLKQEHALICLVISGTQNKSVI